MTKKSICLNFEVHQPTGLRLFRFFDIGKDSHYYNDFGNRTLLKRVAKECYLPMNALLLEMVEKSKGKFRISFTISGSALEMFDRYAPEVTESFKALASTGCVEFVCEPYYHSLSSLSSMQEFRNQVLKHKETIEHVFGVKSTSFHNTELIYSDAIGSELGDMGFKTVLTEGAKNVLGWRNPNFVYNCDMNEKVSLLLRNPSLSEDIAVRFSDKNWDVWPLTADTYASWLKASDGDVVNLFFEYSVFGSVHPVESGIFEFFKALPEKVMDSMTFVTPSEAATMFRSVGDLSVPEAMSWAGVENDVSSWLGNELQQDAFNKLFALTEKLSILNDPVLWSDFGHLSESDHFSSMGMSPDRTPYEAYINYMNVLNDFIIRVNGMIAEQKDS